MNAELQFQQGQLPAAIDLWKKALTLEPDWPRVLNNLAWILATCPDEKVNNPVEALQYAQKACELTQFKHPDLLSSLAAAYAANQRFTEAIETAEKTRELYRKDGKDKSIEDLEKQLEAYRVGRPYRETL